MNGSCHTYSCNMSHIWMRHGAHMNTSWHTCKWDLTRTHECVMSHIQTRHIRTRRVTDTDTHMRTHTYECVIAHIWMRQDSWIWMRHITHMHASCRTYEYVMAHVQVRLVSCHTYEWDKIHACGCVTSHMDESRHIWMRHITYRCVTLRKRHIL